MMRGISQLQSLWTIVNGQRIHARVALDQAPPNAPAVVLVPAIGVSSRYMAPLAVHLASDFRVYAVDLPGYGLSDGTEHTPTLRESADALAEWVSGVGLERAGFIGNSLGCQILIEFAVRHPDVPRRLVLQGPTVDRLARSAPRQLLRWLVDNPREHPSEMLAMIADYRDFGAARVVKQFQHALEDRVEEKLPRVSVPTLVVGGTRDPIAPLRWCDEVARLLPQGRLKVIPGGPHTINYTMPLELARVVRPFLLESNDSTLPKTRGNLNDVLPKGAALHR